MFQNLEIFHIAQSAAKHAATRQALVAQNIANADTPAYRAQDLTSFRNVFEQGRPARMIDAGGIASPNGNTVSLETEMLRGVEAERAHSRAIRIYQSALATMRSALAR